MRKNISIPDQLNEDTDKYCKANNITFSGFIQNLIRAEVYSEKALKLVKAKEILEAVSESEEPSVQSTDGREWGRCQMCFTKGSVQEVQVIEDMESIKRKLCSHCQNAVELI